MAKVEARSRVTVHYTGMLEDGTVFDSSLGKEPLQFTLGDKKVIAGVERAMLGMAAGEKKRITLQPEDAYGEYQAGREVTIDRAKLNSEGDPEPGMMVEIHGTDGGCLVTPIKAVAGDKVTLDANHPLAGKTLIFEIELLAIE